MKMSNELQGILLNIIGCAYLTYSLFPDRKRVRKEKATLILVVSMLLGVLLGAADPAGARLVPFSVAAFHFLFRFLRHHCRQIRRNMRSMPQPLRYEQQNSAARKETPAHAERQTT